MSFTRLKPRNTVSQKKKRSIQVCAHLLDFFLLLLVLLRIVQVVVRDHAVVLIPPLGSVHSLVIFTCRALFSLTLYSDVFFAAAIKNKALNGPAVVKTEEVVSPEIH